MSDSENNSFTQDNHPLETVGNAMIRFVLANNGSVTKTAVINRAKMLQTLNEIVNKEGVKPIPFNKVYEYMDSKLMETFGYHLYGVAAGKKSGTKRPFSATQTETQMQTQAPVNTQTQGEAGNGTTSVVPSEVAGQDLKSRGQYFVLIRNYDTSQLHRYNKFILDHASNMYHRKVSTDNLAYEGNDYSLNLDPTLDNDIGNGDALLALKGIITITICIVLLSKNSILESELLQHYEKFGIFNDGRDIPIIRMPCTDLLNLLVKNNYLSKSQEKQADLQQEIVIYTIGRRTLIEFPKHSLVNLCKEVLDLDDSQLDLLQNTVQVLAANAYEES